MHDYFGCNCNKQLIPQAKSNINHIITFSLAYPISKNKKSLFNYHL